ncbi:MAG: Com family DNA-binding transcriptional regulator [Desulfobacterales bacterium]|nr:Com family DNA-binding transcriptional regulator [Desulfobacterales bacterium]
MNPPQKYKMTRSDIQTAMASLAKEAGMTMEREYRCPVCKRLLLKGKIIEIETRCPKCKKLCRIKGP